MYGKNVANSPAFLPAPLWMGAGDNLNLPLGAGQGETSTFTVPE